MVFSYKKIFKGIVKSILAFAAGIIVASIVIASDPENFYWTHFASNKAFLQHGEDEIKRKFTLPKKIDEITSVTAIRVDIPNMAIVYDVDIAEPLADLEKEDIQTALKDRAKQLCAASLHNGLFKKGIHYKWIYHFKGDGRILENTLRPEDCILGK